MNNFNINRRRFLKGATASLALTALGARGIDIINPQKMLRVGLIGTGWYGKSDLFRLIQVVPVDVVALCDVDKNQLTAAATLVSQRQKSGKQPRMYNDYRKMLSENQMDIVLIGTPDHWHALQTIDAVKSGANVYVQKPISVDVMEGEAMVAAARKYNRVVQVGTQRKSTPHLIDAKKTIVDTGLLGKVSHVEMCCYIHMRSNGNPAVQSVPDFWITTCGPAPRLYVRTMACRISGGGALLWNTAMASWVICVFICSTRFGGCLSWDGQHASAQLAAYMYKKKASLILPIHKLLHLNIMA